MNSKKYDTTKPRIILDGWTEFEARCIPKNAPELQRIEMRKAFFCGASLLFARLHEAGNAPEGTAFKLFDALFDAVQEEVDMFVQLAIADGLKIQRVELKPIFSRNDDVLAKEKAN